jgi:hypothetical protein
MEMNVFLLGVLLLFIVSFIYGIYNSYEWEFGIVFNPLKIPLYKIGLFCERSFVTFEDEDTSEEFMVVVDEVCIGMLIFELVFRFKKDFEP